MTGVCSLRYARRMILPSELLRVAQTGKDGIVIGRSTAYVLLETHFGWSLIAPLLRGILALRPVAIGAHGIARDPEGRRDEDMINTARGLELRVEGVECPIGRQPALSDGIRIAQERGGSEERIDLIVLVDVEVPREDDGCSLRRKRPNTAQDEACRFGTRLAPHVVEMEVEEIESAVRLPIFKFAPRADADAGSIPAEGGAVRSFTEPEVTRPHLLEPCFVVEDSGVFPIFAPIIAPDTDVVIFGESLQEVVDLPDLRLLRPEDIGAFVGEEFADDGAALPPAIAVLGIPVILIADVVCPDKKALRLHADDSEEAKRKGKKSLHNAS